MKAKTIPIVILLLFPPALLAGAPHWWYEYGVLSEGDPDDYAAVNQGQLKHITAAAYEYLDDHLPGGAQQELDDLENLVSSWASPGSGVDDFQAINMGQLKYVSSYVYDCLIATGLASAYPWSRSGQADDYAMVNLGQLKNVFSFDIVYPKVVAMTGTLDVFVNQQMAGSYFEWILEHEVPAGDSGFHDDPANDGVPNLLKYAMGLDPMVPSSASTPEVDNSYTHDNEDYFAVWFDRPQGGAGNIEYNLLASEDLVNYDLITDPTIIIEDDPEEAAGLESGYERVWMFDGNYPLSEHSGSYFLVLQMVIAGEEDALFFDLFHEESNMIVHNVTFIGESSMRGAFEDGNAHGLDIDEGFLFSTGIAEDWNRHNMRQNERHEFEGDQDLEEWMYDEGFSEYNPGLSESPTRDASGVTIEFETDFSGAGTIEMAFLFASDEYYEPEDDKDNPKGMSANDGMAVFLFEIDSNGEIIQSSRENIGVLPASDTNSDAINVYNVGEFFQNSDTPSGCNNLSYFIKNSPYADNYLFECSGHSALPSQCGAPPSDPEIPNSPCEVGYTGFTSRIEAHADVDGGKRYLIKIVVADMIEIIGSLVGDAGFDSAVFMENGSIRCIPDE